MRGRFTERHLLIAMSSAVLVLFGGIFRSHGIFQNLSFDHVPTFVYLIHLANGSRDAAAGFDEVCDTAPLVFHR